MQASRHLSSLKNDTKRIELLGAQILDFLSHLTEQRKQNCGIYSLPHSDEEIISQCRVILYLAYEFIAVIPKSTSKKQSAINCISEDFFQVVRSFILLCRDMLPTNGSRWEWSLFIDLLERSSMPIHFVSTQIDISKLTNLDKGLISKLVQLILSHFPSNLSYDTGSNHTIIFPILLKFVISSDQQILEYSSKLLSLSFQTILKSDEFSELVIVDIISVALSFLGESLCMNIPLVDYLIRMMPVAMAKISPSDQPIPQNNIVHNHLMEQITLFFCRSTMFILKKDVPCERMNLFYSIFPSIWIQCERMWAKNENLLPNIPKFLVVSNSLFGCLIEEISSSHREQLVTLFCRWVVYSLSTSPQDYKLDNEIQNLNGNHFTEMWLAHLVFELESKVGIEWEASVDWNSFSCRCKDLVETLTSHLATLFSISQDETFQLFNFSILSQIFWKYENRWKSEQCPLQYQIFSSTNHSTLGALPEVTSKKGKAKKINSVLCSISRFRHAVLRLRWKICERSYSVESVVLSQALSDDVLRDITITLDLFREISLLDNFHPIETYDLVDLCYQLHNIIGLHADFTLRLQLLESVHNLSENQLIDIYWRKSFQNFATDLKLLLLAWSLYNGCFDEYLLVDQTFAVDQHDTEFSLLFSEWISSASSLFLLINKRNIDFPDLETFKTSTENIFKLCRIGQHYLHGAWVSLLYSKLQLLLNGNFVESLSWSKQVLSLKLLDKRHQTLLGYLEIELETMLHICDIYDCLGSVEKCLSYLSEAKLLSCTGFGASTYLRHIYALHGLRIWKRTKSSRFSSELENGLFDKINSGSLLGKIRVNFEIIRDLDKFFSLEVNIQQKFQYRYMDMLWNVGTGSMSPPIYFAPLNLKIKPFLVPISSINLNTPSFSGFRRFSLESVQDILASEILLRSGYFDIERDYRRSVALNIVLKSLETSSSTSNISQGHADNFLVWFMIASSNNISIEKSLMNSELTRSNLPIISSLFQKVYEGDLNVLQHIRDNLLNSEKVICSVVLDHLSKQILITRLDQQQSFTVALGVNAFQEVTNLIMEWDEIMSANRTQLSQTTDPEKVLSWKAADKKRWWLERDNLDLRIERLLRDLEEKFGVWKCLLTSSNSFVISDGIVESIRSWIAQKHISKKESRSRLDSNKIEESLSGFLTWLKLVLSDGALADECEQITATQDLFTWISTVLCLQSTTEELLQLSIQIVREAQSSSHSKSQPIIQEPIEDITQRLSGLKVADLKEELKAHGLDTTGKKGELYNRLLEYFKSNQSPSDNAEEEVVSSDHLILILDESLQSIPFECLPALRSKSCSRVPSLLFLLHQLHQKEIHSQNLSKTKEKKKKNSEEEVVISPRHAVSLSKCWYSIDPEANLVSTRNNLMQFLEYYITKWNWKGFAGQQPPEDIVR